MNFEKHLIRQINIHGSMRPQDIVKLCYQAARGAEHLLTDTEVAREYFEREYEIIQPCDIPLYEHISDNICRVNLAAWKFKRLDRERLFEMFAASVASNGDDRLSDYIERAGEVLKNAKVSFTQNDWKSYIEEYKKRGMPPVHHSDVYRKCEQPAYRIVSTRYIDEINLLYGLEQKEKI